jgi:hypothetical protein
MTSWMKRASERAGGARTRAALMCVAALATSLRVSGASAAGDPPSRPNPPPNQNGAAPGVRTDFQLEAVLLGPTLSLVVSPHPALDLGGELSAYFGAPGVRWGTGFTLGASRDRYYAEALLTWIGERTATIVGAGPSREHGLRSASGGQVSVSQALWVLFLPAITASVGFYPGHAPDWVVFEVGLSAKIGGGF